MPPCLGVAGHSGNDGQAQLNDAEQGEGAQASGFSQASGSGRQGPQAAKELPVPDRTLLLHDLARIPSAVPATSEPPAAAIAATAPQSPEPRPGTPP